MEACVIVTYRCNAKCSMCNTWRHPTRPDEEQTPKTVDMLPDGLSFINITGGEPFIRQDLPEIVDVALRKAGRVVVSTNGYFTDRIVSLARRHPSLGVRISIEGLPATNDELRGLKDGFDHGLRSLLELRALGLKDIGFGITVSDRNANDLLELYRLAESMRLEFATAATHNSYYFHKHDNSFEDPDMVATRFEELYCMMLKSGRIKDWFRAYFNRGLANYVRGGRRPFPCGAGSDFFFVDPFGRITPCNGSDEEMVMGVLGEQGFDEIWHSERAAAIRGLVNACTKNCWMIGSAAPAIKKNLKDAVKWILMRKAGLNEQSTAA